MGNMCEILGVNGRTSMEYNDYLDEFYRHSVDHPHGWGLATFQEQNVQIEKEPVRADKSAYLKERLRTPVTGKQIMTHIRYATIGNTDYVNCHPFTGTDRSGRRWTFMHNGTIFDFDPLYRYAKIQRGETDSERVFLYLCDWMNEQIEKNGNRDLDSRTRFEILDKLVCRLSLHNKLNLMIHDGDYFYVHTNCKGTLYYLMNEERVFVATVPLGTQKDLWKPVPMTTLLAFREGRLMKTGTDHGHEYTEKPEDYKDLYLDFSNL